MKYGPIISNPKSDKVQALFGKKVFYSDIYSELDDVDDSMRPLTFRHIVYNAEYPFIVEDDNGNQAGFTFIREAIEEKPTYRPYKDCEEMIDDYCERFGVVKTDFAMPMIWVKLDKLERRILLTQFASESVSLEGISNRTLPELFNVFTYLDGSPVGKEE